MALVHMHGLFVCLHRGGSAAPVGGRRVSLLTWLGFTLVLGACAVQRKRALSTPPQLDRSVEDDAVVEATPVPPTGRARLAVQSPAVPVLTVLQSAVCNSAAECAAGACRCY